MTALHTALTSLGPTEWSTVPQKPNDLTAYLQSAFESAQTIIDSVPLPPPSETPASRPRSQTSSSEVSNGLEITASTARSDLLEPENAPLQKEWGKPLKMNAKDNPLGISTYKLAGKDGNGAWFARRSVHEGMGFQKWRLGLEREFPETLEVQGGPGEGNIRGIGGERRVERMSVDGVGTEEVYHLTAQFPGPSSPRDFVTLLLTSSTALSSSKGSSRKFKASPRHFMVISRPCIHPECPPRSGFVRGQYESVEFIREVPRRPRRSVSAMDLTVSSPSQDEQKRQGTSKANDVDEGATERGQSPAGRQRGQTISFAKPSSSVKATRDDEGSIRDDELNPVEWVMVTRSDPGGSVPRFMVERGTPGSIVADASKFLDWATKKEHSEGVSEPSGGSRLERIESEDDASLNPTNTNGHLAGLVDVNGSNDSETSGALDEKPALVQETVSEGVMTSMANFAISSIENNAPQAVIDRMPGHGQTSPNAAQAGPESTTIADGLETKSGPSSGSSSPTASFVSFSSADEYFDEALSTKSPSSQNKSTKRGKESAQEKELAKLNERKRLLDEKLTKTKEKGTKDQEELTAKEKDRIRKAEEKHAREITKHEDRYTKQLAKLEAKQRKVEGKDEKTRLVKEREDLKRELESVKRERDLLKDQIGALQKENTGLVVGLGRFEEGKDVLKEVKAEISRSRSSSFRRNRPATPEKSKDATILSKDSPLKENVQPS